MDELVKHANNEIEETRVVNWKLNMKLCREAVMKYRKKWANNMKVDRRVLSDWVNAVMACITEC